MALKMQSNTYCTCNAPVTCVSSNMYYKRAITKTHDTLTKMSANPNSSLNNRYKSRFEAV